MLPQRRKIPSADLAFVSGQTVSQSLPTAYVVEGYDLFIKPRLVVAGGTTSSTATSAAAQRDFIKLIKVVTNGGKNVRVITGAELFQMNMLLRGTAPAQTAISGALAAATYNAALHYHIPARILRADAMPNDPKILSLGHASWGEATSFHTSSYDEITLEIEYGTVADFSDGAGDRTETLTVPTIELYERYARTESLTSAQEDMRAYTTAMFERKTFTITAADEDFSCALPRAVGKSITRILIKATTDGVLSDSVVNFITLKANENVDLVKKISWGLQQAVNKETYQAEAEMEAGYAVLDFMDDKNLGDVLNTAAWRDLALVLDVNNPGSVDKIILVIESVQS